MNRDHAQRVLFEQLKRTVPIEAVLAKYGHELKRQGSKSLGKCPIHHGTNDRQFVVSNGLWRCFGDCDRGGSVIDLYMELERLGSVREAALHLAEWFHIKPGSDVQHRKPKESAMSEGRSPDFKVYASQKREGQKDYLTRIGSAWKFSTKDNRPGVSIQLSALPIGDRIVLFEADEEEQEEADDKSNGKRRK